MKVIGYVITLLLLSATGAFATEYNYIAPETVKQNLAAGTEMMIVDIQVEEEFRQHHIPGSLATFAYPAKSTEDKAKLDQALNMYRQSGKSIVIVCPRGAGGAKRSYDYLKENGVQNEKLLILENGMSGWPYAELTVTGN